jgi:hypothetical protein
LIDYFHYFASAATSFRLRCHASYYAFRRQASHYLAGFHCRPASAAADYFDAAILDIIDTFSLFRR